MNTVEIHHIIDDCHKEIYEFEGHRNEWRYVGISYSNRDDKNDVWGDEWSKHFEKQRQKELDELAMKYGYENWGEFESEFCECCDYQKLRESEKINKKYNPCRLKTKRGETRYTGRWFGSQKEPKPKMGKKELAAAITAKMGKVKVILD